MNLLKKLTKKNLQLNKKRTIVTIIGIMLSVGLITAVATMFVSLYQSIINFELKEDGNFHVSFNNVEPDNLKYIKENRYVEDYYPVKEIGYAKLENSRNESKPYLYIAGFNKKSLNNLAINLVDGRLPENNHEIIIPTHLKTNGRVEYHIGDKITIEVGTRMRGGEVLSQENPYGEVYREGDHEEETEEYSEEIVNTKQYTYTIVGIMERPSNYVEEYSAPGYTCITYEENPTGTIDVYVRLNKKGIKNAAKAIAGILDVDERLFTKFWKNSITDDEFQELEKELESSRFELKDYNVYLMLLEEGLFKDTTFKNLAYVAGFVCLIIIVTSVFCIKNSFDISISEKTKQYGMLSSIGATKKQIKKNVYYEAFRLGIIGIPLGVILGIIASEILVLLCNVLLLDMLNAKIVCSISLLAIVFGAILGMVTIFFSSMYSAVRASRITPINAIRNSDDIKINPKKVKSSKLIKKLFGIGGDISNKNLKRSKKKYRTTVISIIVCVAVYIALSSFMHTFYQYLVVEYSATDYNITFTARAVDYKAFHEKVATINSRDDIKDYSITETNTAYVKNAKYTKNYQDLLDKREEEYARWEDLEEKPKGYEQGFSNVVRIDDHQYRKYLKKLGLDYENNKDKIIILNQVQEYDAVKKDMVKMLCLDYKKGDKVTIGYLDYNEKDEYVLKAEREYEVAEVTTERPFGMQYISSVPVIIVTESTYYDLFGREVHNEVYYYDVEDPDKFQDDIEKLLKDDAIDVYNVAEEQRMMKSLHLLIAIFLYGFITVIALIGITNIFNTITTNMELRKREFATLKSVGMTTKEFNRMISLESFLYGTKSLIIGIPIGIILSVYLNKILNDGGETVVFKMPYTSIIISIIVVFILIFAIMKYSISKINKQNTIETIRNENI